MNIGMSVELWEWQHSSGVIVAVKKLREYLTLQHHKVILFTPFVRYQYRGSANFPVVSLPSYRFGGKRWSRPYLLPWEWRDLQTSVYHHNIQLFHLQGHYGCDMVLSRIAAQTKIPCVATYHTYSAAYIESRCQNPISRYLGHYFDQKGFEAIKKVTSYFFAPSNFAKQLLIKEGIPAERILVIPTPVSIPNPLPSQKEARELLCLPKDKKIFLYLGRVAPEKNLDFLIQAFFQGHIRYPETMLLLLGNIDREVPCKENVICFTGVPHEKIWIYLAASDIFVYPSCTETQGIAVSEAMACGLPIVVVNEGGAHEAIEHNISGQKVPNKVEEFASAMERFIQFPDFAQKMRRGREK